MTQLVHPDDAQRNRDIESDLTITPGPTTDFGDNAYAAAKEIMLANSIRAETALEERIIASRKREYEKQMDENVVNYMNPPYVRERENVAQDRFDPGTLVTELGREFGGIPLIDTGVPIAEEKDKKEFYNKMQKAYKKTGNEFFNLTPEKMDKLIAKRAQKAEENLHDVRERSYSSSGWAGRLTGQLGSATLGDPLNASTLGLGAAKGLGLMKTFALEFGIEGGIEAFQQPDIQEMRDNFGLSNSSERAWTNILMAGVGGGTLGTLGQGAGKLVKEYRVRGIQSKLSQRGLNDDVARDIAERVNEEGMTEDIGKEISQRLSKVGGQTKETEAVRKIIETKQMVERMNPYSDPDTTRYSEGQQTFNKNLEIATQAVNRAEPARAIDSKSQPPVRKEFGDEYTEVKSADIRQNAKSTIDRNENDVTPVIFKTEDGTMELVEGDLNGRAYKEASGDNVKAYVINESNNLSREEAQSFALGRRLEEGRASKKDIADLMGVDKSELNIPDKSIFVENTQKMLELKPNALRLALDENVSPQLAAEVARRFDDGGVQTRAINTAKGAKNNEVAKDILARGEKNGFETLTPEKVKQKRRKILEDSIDKLRSGERTIQLSDGSEVEIDNEFLSGLRRLSEESSFLQSALTRSSAQSLSEGSGRTGSDEFIESIGEAFRDGPLTRNDISKAGNIQESRGVEAQALTVDFKQSRQEGKVEQSIIEGEHPIFDEINTRLEQNDFKGQKFPDLRSDDVESKIDIEDMRKRWEQDEQAIKEAEACSV